MKSNSLKSPLFIALLAISLPIAFITLAISVLPAIAKIATTILSQSYPPAIVTAPTLALGVFLQYQFC
jgi:hypothetical protein